jgi:proline iminopeptidase
VVAAVRLTQEHESQRTRKDETRDMAAPFDVELSMQEPPAEAEARAATALSEPARLVGLRLTKRSAGELQYRPRVQFPFVIMGWHYLNGERMTVRFSPAEGSGTRITISGAVARSKHALAADPEHWTETLRGATPAGAYAVGMPTLSESIHLSPARRASYEVVGHGEPILYFQGGPGYSASLLRDDAKLLSDRFAVYLVDPHGSGGSTPPSDPSLYDHIGHARFYDEVRRALGLGEVTAMGISFGSIVALTYAALYPEATLRCIAIATRAVGADHETDEQGAEMERFLARHAHAPWYPSARRTFDDWTERVLAASDAREVDAMMAEVLPLYTADPERPGVKRLIEAWRRGARTDLAAVKAWEGGLWQTIDIRPLLGRIVCPTLLLVGALDSICGPSQASLVAKEIPHAEVVTIAESGHFVPAEAPEAFTEAVFRFCER